MSNLNDLLKNVKTLKSIIGETKSITPDLLNIFSMLGVGNKQSNGIANLIAKFANSPYLILGVMKDDPPDLIDAVYRIKAKYYHPDNKKTGNREKFLKLKDAYDKILS